MSLGIYVIYRIEENKKMKDFEFEKFIYIEIYFEKCYNPKVK